MSWWDEYVVPNLTRPEVPATLGAILGWLGAPGETVRQQAFNLLAGIGCALYVAPYVSQVLGVTSPAGEYFFVFILGMLGMNLLAKAIEASRGMTLFQILKSIVRLQRPPDDQWRDR